jgi:hypothetical protein
MIDYEEELKKFKPLPDVEQAEEAIYNRDLTDLADVMQQMIDRDGRPFRTRER